MTVAIAVVADVRRGGMGRDLAEQVKADHISGDDGTLGCRGNHVKAWTWHAKNPADWHLVLEDDAQPVPDFRAQLDAALDAAPANIVSLYLGGGYIDDILVKNSIEKAERTGADWITTQGRVLSAVAVAMRHDMVAPMLTGLDTRRGHAIDRAMSLWTRGFAQRVAYPVPSLVDHADQPSLVRPHRRCAPRRAMRVGGHEHWGSKTIFMV